MDNPTVMIKFLVHYAMGGFATLSNITAPSSFIAAAPVNRGQVSTWRRSYGNINQRLILLGSRPSRHLLKFMGIQPEQITRPGEVGPAFANTLMTADAAVYRIDRF